MYASDAKDELNPCCPFAETVLRPGSVLLLRCEVGAEEEIHQRVTEEYDNGTPTLAMVHGGHWWPVLVFVRQGDEAHLAERTAYVGDDEQACWRAIVAYWTHPADGLVRDLCADDGRILAAADAAQRRAVGLCRDEAQVERVRAEGRTRQGRTAGMDGKVGWPGGGRASGRSAAATRGEDKPHVRVALGAPALPPGGRWIATPVDRRGCSHSAKSPGPPRLRSLLSPPVRVLSRSDRGGPSRSRRVAGHRVGRLLGSPVRTGPGPSRLRRLTSVRCRNPPFLLSPIPSLVGSVASRCRLRRSTASRRLRPDRPGLRVHGRASAPRTARTGSCRWSRSTRRTFLLRRT